MARPRAKDVSEKYATGIGLLTSRERFSAVLAQFRDGAGTIDQVVAALKQQFPRIEWKREEIYHLLRTGLAEGYISLEPDRAQNLEQRLINDFGLTEAAVVPSVYFPDVALRAARLVLKIIDEHAAAGKKKVGVGFASGFSISHVARALGQLLLTTGAKLPEELQFHSLSAGFNPRFLCEDPNFFLSAFDPVLLKQRTGTNISFIGLYAPSIIRTEQLESIRLTEGIREAIGAKNEIDIVVTGASDFDDENSTLSTFYDQARSPEIEEEREALLKAGIIGHLLYLPLADAGPIREDQHKFILPTILTLDDLHEMITDSERDVPARVVLVAGLRVATFGIKKIIATVLRQKRPLITDLATSERNVRAVM